MSESGERVALIDEDDQVRMYFVADDKPFLVSARESASAIAPDAGWIATAQKRLTEASHRPIDVIRLEGVQSSDLHPRTRIVLDVLLRPHVRRPGMP